MEPRPPTHLLLPGPHGVPILQPMHPQHFQLPQQQQQQIHHHQQQLMLQHHHQQQQHQQQQQQMMMMRPPASYPPRLSSGQTYFTLESLNNNNPGAGIAPPVHPLPAAAVMQHHQMQQQFIPRMMMPPLVHVPVQQLQLQPHLQQQQQQIIPGQIGMPNAIPAHPLHAPYVMRPPAVPAPELARAGPVQNPLIPGAVHRPMQISAHGSLNNQAVGAPQASVNAFGLPVTGLHGELHTLKNVPMLPGSAGAVRALNNASELQVSLVEQVHKGQGSAPSLLAGTSSLMPLSESPAQGDLAGIGRHIGQTNHDSIVEKYVSIFGGGEPSSSVSRFQSLSDPGDGSADQMSSSIIDAYSFRPSGNLRDREMEKIKIRAQILEEEELIRRKEMELRELELENERLRRRTTVPSMQLRKREAEDEVERLQDQIEMERRLLRYEGDRQPFLPSQQREVADEVQGIQNRIEMERRLLHHEGDRPLFKPSQEAVTSTQQLTMQLQKVQRLLEEVKEEKKKARRMAFASLPQSKPKKKKSVEATDKANSRCFNCNKKGHLVKECVAPKMQKKGEKSMEESMESRKAQIMCYRCGQNGHYKSICPLDKKAKLQEENDDGQEDCDE